MARLRKMKLPVAPETPNTNQEKPATATPATPDHQEQETVTLNFEAATDVVEPEKPSKIGKIASKVFTSLEEPEKKTARKKSTFFVKNVELVTGGLLFCIHMLVPEEYKEVFYVGERAYQYLPTDKQLNDILTPLARIADRHTHIADINPDVLDVIACGQAATAYGMELRATIILKNHLDKQAKQAKQTEQTEQWRNRLNGFNAIP